MERNKVKQGVMIITYAALVLLFLVYCKDILRGVAAIVALFKPFLIGVAIAFVLNQPYCWLKRVFSEKLHLKEKPTHYLAVTAAYLLVFAILAAVIGVVIPQIVNSVRLFAMNLDNYLINLQGELNTLAEYLNREAIDLSSLVQLVSERLGQIDDIVGEVVPRVVSATGSMVSSIANLFIALAFSVYLLSGKEKILSQFDRVLRAYLPEKHYGHLRYLLDVVVMSFKNYIIGQSTEAVILGSLCCVGMLVLRLDYAGMVSMVVGVTAFIPILGAYIGGVVAVVLLLMVSPVKALIFLIFFVLLQQVENNVIYPRVVGGRLGLPGIWVLLAITVGGQIGGVVGMLFAVPTATVIYTLVKNSVRSHEKRKEKLSCKK
ncbi:MAG TPA: AI-2E family transporter [Candidatus Butyricicoccus stercorigallinarum]|nr:AI-2E family transporter [Candidatus Butyricicoccus stercorigallinarum]